MWSTTQVPHIARVTLSGVTGIPESKLRVIAPDVGGGFGSKLNVYAEEALALAVARRLGRAGQVDRDAQRGLPGHDSRPRPDPGDRARSDGRGEDHRGSDEADRRDGCVSPARDAGHPAARRVAVRRLRTTSRATASSARACSRTRRRRMRTAAPDARRRRMRSSAPSTRSRASSARIRSRSGG